MSGILHRTSQFGQVALKAGIVAGVLWGGYQLAKKLSQQDGKSTPKSASTKSQSSTVPAINLRAERLRKLESLDESLKTIATKLPSSLKSDLEININKLRTNWNSPQFDSQFAELSQNFNISLNKVKQIQKIVEQQQQEWAKRGYEAKKITYLNGDALLDFSAEYTSRVRIPFDFEDNNRLLNSNRTFNKSEVLEQLNKQGYKVAS